MFLNLKQVNHRGNALGLGIVRNWKEKPAEVLNTIRDMYRENPQAIIDTIGLPNTIALGLLDPVQKFLQYFPCGSIYGRTVELSGKGASFSYETFSRLFYDLKRAKAIVEDLRLNLKVRSISRGKSHTLFIDRI